MLAGGEEHNISKNQPDPTVKYLNKIKLSIWPLIKSIGLLKI
jgi:hypothetical protein